MCILEKRTYAFQEACTKYLTYTLKHFIKLLVYPILQTATSGRIRLPTVAISEAWRGLLGRQQTLNLDLYKYVYIQNNLYMRVKCVRFHYRIY